MRSVCFSCNCWEVYWNLTVDVVLAVEDVVDVIVDV